MGHNRFDLWPDTPKFDHFVPMSLHRSRSPCRNPHMPNTDDSATHANVRAELARHDAIQGDVADWLSLSHSAVSRRMRGETPFRNVELQCIAKRLGISLQSLLGADHELRRLAARLNVSVDSLVEDQDPEGISA